MPRIAERADRKTKIRIRATDYIAIPRVLGWRMVAYMPLSTKVVVSMPVSGVP
ncbi:MAG: hypothetical protein KAU52_08355 [Methanosarcinales archaeon]|nr:hypothetical protein [Methanosarcinales archaeon]